MFPITIIEFKVRTIEAKKEWKVKNVEDNLDWSSNTIFCTDGFNLLITKNIKSDR